MTPPHGTKMDGDGEAAHMHRCENEEGGPVFSVKAKVDAMALKVDKVMLRQATWNGGFMVLQIIAMAIFGAWLSSRFAPQSHPTTAAPSSMFNQAHAETKGTP